MFVAEKVLLLLVISLTVDPGPTVAKEDHTVPTVPIWLLCSVRYTKKSERETRVIMKSGDLGDANQGRKQTSGTNGASDEACIHADEVANKKLMKFCERNGKLSPE